MRITAILLVSVLSGLAIAQLVGPKLAPKPNEKAAPASTPVPTPAPTPSGSWRGFITMGPSKIAQTMDVDGLLKLQMTKAYLKTFRYDLQLMPDKRFFTTVKGVDEISRKGSGTWVLAGQDLILTMIQENGVKQRRILKGSMTPDAKKFVVVIPSKPGLPVSKLVFLRPEAFNPKPASKPVATTKPKA